MCALWTSGDSRDPLRGPVRSQTFLYNTKVLFRFLIVLTYAMTVQKPATLHNSGGAPNHARPHHTLQHQLTVCRTDATSHACNSHPPCPLPTGNHFVLYICESLHLGMFFMKLKQLLTLWNLDPWVPGFLIVCEEMEVLIKHSRCASKYDGGLEENRRAISQLPVFSHRHHFRLTDSWHKMQISSLSVWQIFSLKWTEWNCHFKENSWQYLLLMIKLTLSSN